MAIKERSCCIPDPYNIFVKAQLQKNELYIGIESPRYVNTCYPRHTCATRGLVYRPVLDVPRLRDCTYAVCLSLGS